MVASLVGVTLGAVAGYYGGKTDSIISRIMEIFQAFPDLIFAMAIMTFMGKGVLNLFIALGLLTWVRTARMIRGSVMQLKEKEYIYENEMGFNRIGISVSKKVGNSVVRHGICRKIREIFRLNNINMKTGYDIVTVIRPAAKDADYKKLEDAYCRLAERHNIIIKADDKF